MAWTECTSGQAIVKAGVNANSTITASGSVLVLWSTEAEGSIDLETGKTILSSYASLPAGVQGAVSDICSSKIAMKIIAYDTTGYLSREADILLNVNDDIITKGLAKLKEFTNLKLKSPTT